MSHLDPGILHELLDGEIPSPDLVPIQAHLASCEECRTRLEYERQLQSDADGLVAVIDVPLTAAPRVSRTFRRSSRVPPQPRLAWAATVLLAAGLGYLARGPGSALVAPQESVAVPPNAGVQAIPATPTVSDTSVTTVTRQSAPPARVSAPAPREPLARQQQKTAPGSSGAASGGSARELHDQSAAKLQAGAPAPGAAVADAATTTKPGERRVDSVAKSAGRALAPSGFVAGTAAARTLDESRRADAPAMNALAAKQALDSPGVAGEPITLSEAIRRLGGTLRLIDGLVPVRLEFREPYVRVVYPEARGELVLQQQLVDGRVLYQIIPPRGFPADSVARLRAKVKE